MVRRAALWLVLLVAVAPALDEGFEGSQFPPAGWGVMNLDSGARRWQRLDIGGRTRPASAYCGWEGHNLRNNDWLVTPRCSVVAGDQLRFFTRAADVAFRESVEVYVSTGGPRPFEFSLMLAYGTNSVEYERRITLLDGLAGHLAFFAFVYRSHNRYAMLLDDVSGPAVWSPSHDVGVDSILAPPVDLRVGRLFRPSCRARNYTMTPAVVRLNCDVGGLAQSDTTVLLGGLESRVVEFEPMAVWQPGDYAVTCAALFDADESPWNDTALGGFRVHDFSSRGGPDSLGYVWRDSDDSEGPAYDWLELVPGGTLIGTGSDSLWRLRLPWSVPYYGADYDWCWVSSNGWLGLGPPAQVSPADSNTPVPSPSLPNRAIYPYWDGLVIDPGEASVWYRNLADTCLVFEWYHGRHRNGSRGGLDFQVKLFRSGAIEFHYAGVNSGDTAADAGRSATVGIEDASGRIGLQYLFDGVPAANRLEVGRAIRFESSPPAVNEPAPAVTLPRLRLSPACTRGPVVIDVVGACASSGDVQIHDRCGRLRRVLTLAPTGPNRLTAMWDGSDSDGEPVTTGAYFVRARAGKVELRQKLVVIR